MKRYNLSLKDSKRPVLIVSAKAMQHINLLHQAFPNTEFGGKTKLMLQGDLSKGIENLKVTLVDFLACGIGNSAYFSFKESDILGDFYKMFPDMDKSVDINTNNFVDLHGNNDKKLMSGLIHTHHNLSNGTTFSEQDFKELEDNVDNYGLYISIIVHHDCQYSAKGAFLVKSETSFKNSELSFDLNVEPVIESVLFSFDFDIVLQTTSQYNSEIKKLKNIKKESEKVFPIKELPKATSFGDFLSEDVWIDGVDYVITFYTKRDYIQSARIKASNVFLSSNSDTFRTLNQYYKQYIYEPFNSKS